MTRIPAHRRKRDPYGRAILAPRITPPAPPYTDMRFHSIKEMDAAPAQVPVAVRTEVEEDWPSPPVPLTGDEDPDDVEPDGPAPTVDPDPLTDVYHHVLEPYPGGGWLSLYCLRCGAAWQDCGCVLAPDRRWTTTGTVVDFARLIHGRRDALRLAGAR